VERQERARRSEADIVQVVAALAVALVVEVGAVLAACMGVASIAGWVMDHMQIQGQHHSVGSEVLYRHTAAAAVVGEPVVVVVVAGGNSGTSPGVEIGASIEKLRVTDGFRGSQSAV
jgi:predicted thioesterase